MDRNNIKRTELHTVARIHKPARIFLAGQGNLGGNDTNCGGSPHGYEPAALTVIVFNLKLDSLSLPLFIVCRVNISVTFAYQFIFPLIIL